MNTCFSKIFSRRMAAGLAVLATVLLASTASFAQDGAQNPVNAWNGANPKYVFMFIGDGLGLQQICAAEAYLGSVQPGAAERSNPGQVKLSFSSFPGQGLSTTYSANSFITDSAPAGTALATGYKTDNGVIGVNPRFDTSFPTIAEAAKAAGLRVGIVTTVSLNHATPAAYYAHIPSRNDYYDIGLQMLDSGFDYFAGGGLHRHQGSEGQTDLYDIAAASGVNVLRDRDGIMGVQYEGRPVLAVNANLDSSNAMPYDMDADNGDVSLAEFVAKGVELLDNENGFFMMIEGGKIDWACHANDAAASIRDTLALDEAVRVAMDFAAAHPEDTLIVLTGDHETGGMSLGFAGTEYETFYDKIALQAGSYLDFDQFIASVRADKGAQATLADISSEIESFFGLRFLSEEQATQLKEQNTVDSRAVLHMNLSATERQQIAEALAKSMAGDRVTDATNRDFLLYGGYEPLSIQLTHILNNKAGIGWTSYAHTGIPVPVFATGPGHEVFNGYYDNTDVAWKLYNVMGLAVPAPVAFSASR